MVSERRGRGSYVPKIRLLGTNGTKLSKSEYKTDQKFHGTIKNGLKMMHSFLSVYFSVYWTNMTELVKEGSIRM